MPRETDTFTGSTIAALLAAALLIVVILAAGGCATPAPPKPDLPQTVFVPVATGCVAGERPAPVKPLNQIYTVQQWQAKTVRQKAALVGAKALEHQSYGEALNAATGACR